MGYPVGSEPYTLAQFARRAGISEGRARALHTAKPSGLPRPDGADADGRPLWSASTIDAWCARTGRAVSEDSLWLFRAEPASAPAVELRRGRVVLRGQAFYAIVWDTEAGHVVYLQALDDTGGHHRDWLAVAAAELIEPRWWPDAVVVLPLEEYLEHERSFPPFAYVYRLGVAGESRDGGAAVGRGQRRWFQRGAPAVSGPARPVAKWEGQLDLADLAKVIGRPVPVWLSGTTLSANAKQSLSYTFTTTDTVTDWPAVQERLIRAVDSRMPAEFPAAFAALAADAADELATLRAAHEKTLDSGDGWYLVCRPARPEPPLAIEQRISSAEVVEDTEQVANELSALRTLEGELDFEDARGDVYAKAIELLEWQLRSATETRSYEAYVPVADDGWLTYSAPWDGPVVEAWQATLTPVENLESTLRLRRVRRLVGEHDVEEIRAGFRDSAGRYVLMVELDSGPPCWSLAEWPASLQVVSAWTDRTVLAADNPDVGAVTLLALTPTEDGSLRVDPVPLSPRSDREAFGYGYSGGTPITSYRALLRVALSDAADVDDIVEWLANSTAEERGSVSQLWNAIVETKGPLRMAWPQLRLWARADQRAARGSAS